VTAQAVPRNRGVLIPALIVLAMLGVMIGLGFWQLERLAWKEGLIATLGQRLSAPPVSLPSHAQWRTLSASTDEFTRVTLRGHYIPSTEARVYSGGTSLRDDIKGPGYFAFAPLRLADGSVVVVNRGHVSNPSPDASLKPIGVSRGAVELDGVLRWPEQPAMLITPYSERQDLWFVRDQRAMAARYGWGDVAPFYIDLESPAPPGGTPRPGPLTVKLRNDHFGYALTWFGLAAVLLVVFVVWAKNRRFKS
jgi:cytochrome oxidase assembly protein ShyY1